MRDGRVVALAEAQDHHRLGQHARRRAQGRHVERLEFDFGAQREGLAVDVHAARHALAQRDARGRGRAGTGQVAAQRALRRRRLRRTGQRQAPVLGQHGHRALGQRGDGERGVDAERHRHDRAVEHRQARQQRRHSRSTRSAVVDAAPAVDHAALAPVGHAATAQRVHGQHRAHALQLADQVGEAAERRYRFPQRVGQHAPAESAHAIVGRMQGAHLRLEHGQRGHLRPRHAHLRVGQHGALAAMTDEADLAGRPVVAHHSVDRRAAQHVVVHGQRIAPFVRRVQVEVHVRERLQRVGRGHHLGQQAAQRRGNGELLDHQRALALRRAGAQQPGDGRPDAALRRRLAFGRAGQRFVVLRRRHRDHVAVGREAAAHGLRYGQARAPGAQQQLGGAQRAGSHHHPPRAHHVGPGVVGACLAPVREEELDGIAAPSRQGRDAVRGAAGEQARAPCVGQRQVVGVQRFLGAVVAAAHAVAAAQAAVHRHLGRRARAVGEGDGDMGLAARRMQPRAGLQQGVELRHALGNLLQAQHGLGLAVALRQRGKIEAPGPGTALEGIGRGALHHRRIDERPAAQPVAEQRVHLAAQAQVEQPRGVAARGPAVLHAEAHVPRQFGEGGRKLARQVFAAALQHVDLDRHGARCDAGRRVQRQRARQACRRHRAAVAAADDQHIAVQRVGRRRGDLAHQHLGALREQAVAGVILVVAATVVHVRLLAEWIADSGMLDGCGQRAAERLVVDRFAQQRQRLPPRRLDHRGVGVGRDHDDG
ncbi:hypothetical protein D9M72_337120 [compost metagenome]